jgi:Glycosyltransferase family 87
MVERALPVLRSVPWRLLLDLAGLVIVGIYAMWWIDRPWNNDARGIYDAWDRGLYALPWLERGAYVYAPPFAQVIWPLARLPFEAFWAAWVTLQVGALILIAGPLLSAVILLLPWPSIPDYPNAVAATIGNGNPQLIMTLGVVAAYRWPAAWALALLMKVTPAVGLLWYVVRREWRNLAMAVGATVVVSGISFAVASDLWLDWFGLLSQATGADARQVELIYLPLAVRLPLALALVGWGAWTDRYWTVPLGVMLSLPAIALGGYAVAVGAIPFLWRGSPSWMRRRPDAATDG